MPLIRKRQWRMPNGYVWETWLVEGWDQYGNHTRRVFVAYADALSHFLKLVEIHRTLVRPAA